MSDRVWEQLAYGLVTDGHGDRAREFTSPLDAIRDANRRIRESLRRPPLDQPIPVTLTLKGQRDLWTGEEKDTVWPMLIVDVQIELPLSPPRWRLKLQHRDHPKMEFEHVYTAEELGL